MKLMQEQKNYHRALLKLVKAHEEMLNTIIECKELYTNINFSEEYEKLTKEVVYNMDNIRCSGYRLKEARDNNKDLK